MFLMKTRIIQFNLTDGFSTPKGGYCFKNPSGSHNRERMNDQWQNGNEGRVVTARKDVASRKNVHSVKKKAHLKKTTEMK